jgi:hypothetical protein
MRYCAMDFLLPTARAAFPAPAAEKRTSHMHAPSAISNPAASTDLDRRHPVPGVGLVWDAWVWGGWGLGHGPGPGWGGWWLGRPLPKNC